MLGLAGKGGLQIFVADGGKLFFRDFTVFFLECTEPSFKCSWCFHSQFSMRSLAVVEGEVLLDYCFQILLG